MAELPAKQPLFAKFPWLAERIAHLPLGQFPTALERLVGPLPPGVEIWVKREDQSGLRYGGNKVRKLEFLLPPLTGQRLFTFGAYASNHVLAAAVYGQALGITVDAVLCPQPLSARVERALLAQLGAGVQQRLCRSYLGVPLALGQAALSSPSPRWVPPGGSSALGTLGWWSGGLELAAQVEAGLAPRFDAVYVAFGSGGTAAGLLLGLGTAAAELVAVRVVPWLAGGRRSIERQVARSRSFVAHQLGSPLPSAPLPRLRVVGTQLGAGYGAPTAAGQRATEVAAACGLALDPTYTAKTFAALLADAATGRLTGKRVLLIHTYNSRELSPLIAAANPRALPAWLRRRLAAGRQ